MLNSEEISRRHKKCTGLLKNYPFLARNSRRTKIHKRSTKKKNNQENSPDAKKRKKITKN